MTPLVVGLGGSTRKKSRSLDALKVALSGADHAGAETSLLDVRELSLPMLDADRPVWELESVRTLLTTVREAGGLLIGSPVYQETVSGALKNALDYLSALEDDDPPGLSGKVVGVISVSGGTPGVGASLAVQTACKGLGAWVLPDTIDLDNTSFDDDGRLYSLLARDSLLALGTKVALNAPDVGSGDQVDAGKRHAHAHAHAHGR